MYDLCVFLDPLSRFTLLFYGVVAATDKGIWRLENETIIPKRLVECNVFLAFAANV
jgi:hypothetical protein